MPGNARANSSAAAAAGVSGGGGDASAWPALLPLGHHQGKPPIPLMRPVLIIGSRHNAHLHLLSRHVSKAHAVIINSDARVYIRDLASRTHVYVNGEEVHERDLQDGDLIKIGTFTFKFQAAAGMKQRPREVKPPEAVLDVDGAEFPVAIGGRVMLIGRRPTCDISLIEDSCSTAHAIIFSMNGTRHVRDLGSRTGTFVNGIKQKQVELSFGDEVRVGETTMRYQPSHVEKPAADGAPTPGAIDEFEDLVGTAPLSAESAAGLDIAPLPPAPKRPAAPVAPSSPPPGRLPRKPAPPPPLPEDSLGATESDLAPLDLGKALEPTPSGDTNLIPLVETPRPAAVPPPLPIAPAPVEEPEPEAPQGVLVSANLINEKLSASATGHGMQAEARKAMEMAAGGEPVAQAKAEPEAPLQPPPVPIEPQPIEPESIEPEPVEPEPIESEPVAEAPLPLSIDEPQMVEAPQLAPEPQLEAHAEPIPFETETATAPAAPVAIEPAPAPEVESELEPTFAAEVEAEIEAAAEAKGVAEEVPGLDQGLDEGLSEADLLAELMPDLPSAVAEPAPASEPAVSVEPAPAVEAIEVIEAPAAQAVESLPPAVEATEVAVPEPAAAALEPALEPEPALPAEPVGAEPEPLVAADFVEPAVPAAEPPAFDLDVTDELLRTESPFEALTAVDAPELTTPGAETPTSESPVEEVPLAEAPAAPPPLSAAPVVEPPPEMAPKGRGWRGWLGLGRRREAAAEPPKRIPPPKSAEVAQPPLPPLPVAVPAAESLVAEVPLDEVPLPEVPLAQVPPIEVPLEGVSYEAAAPVEFGVEPLPAEQQIEPEFAVDAEAPLELEQPVEQAPSSEVEPACEVAEVVEEVGVSEVIVEEVPQAPAEVQSHDAAELPPIEQPAIASELAVEELAVDEPVAAEAAPAPEVASPQAVEAIAPAETIELQHAESIEPIEAIEVEATEFSPEIGSPQPAEPAAESEVPVAAEAEVVPLEHVEPAPAEVPVAAVVPAEPESPGDAVEPAAAVAEVAADVAEPAAVAPEAEVEAEAIVTGDELIFDVAAELGESAPMAIEPAAAAEPEPVVTPEPQPEAKPHVATAAAPEPQVPPEAEIVPVVEPEPEPVASEPEPVAIEPVTQPVAEPVAEPLVEPEASAPPAEQVVVARVGELVAEDIIASDEIDLEGAASEAAGESRSFGAARPMAPLAGGEVIELGDVVDLGLPPAEPQSDLEAIEPLFEALPEGTEPRGVSAFYPDTSAIDALVFDADVAPPVEPVPAGEAAGATSEAPAGAVPEVHAASEAEVAEEPPAEPAAGAVMTGELTGTLYEAIAPQQPPEAPTDSAPAAAEEAEANASAGIASFAGLELGAEPPPADDALARTLSVSAPLPVEPQTVVDALVSHDEAAPAEALAEVPAEALEAAPNEIAAQPEPVAPAEVDAVAWPPLVAEQAVISTVAEQAPTETEPLAMELVPVEPVAEEAPELQVPPESPAATEQLPVESLPPLAEPEVGEEPVAIEPAVVESPEIESPAAEAMAAEAAPVVDQPSTPPAAPETQEIESPVADAPVAEELIAVEQAIALKPPLDDEAAAQSPVAEQAVAAEPPAESLVAALPIVEQTVTEPAIESPAAETTAAEPPVDVAVDAAEVTEAVAELPAAEPVTEEPIVVELPQEPAEFMAESDVIDLGHIEQEAAAEQASEAGGDTLPLDVVAEVHEVDLIVPPAQPLVEPSLVSAMVEPLAAAPEPVAAPAVSTEPVSAEPSAVEPAAEGEPLFFGDETPDQILATAGGEDPDALILGDEPVATPQPSGPAVEVIEATEPTVESALPWDQAVGESTVAGATPSAEATVVTADAASLAQADVPAEGATLSDTALTQQMSEFAGAGVGAIAEESIGVLADAGATALGAPEPSAAAEPPPSVAPAEVEELEVVETEGPAATPESVVARAPAPPPLPMAPVPPTAMLPGGPLFDTGVDQASFLGGMPLVLPELPPPPRRPRFGQVQVNFGADLVGDGDDDDLVIGAARTTISQPEKPAQVAPAVPPPLPQEAEPVEPAFEDAAQTAAVEPPPPLAEQPLVEPAQPPVVPPPLPPAVEAEAAPVEPVDEVPPEEIEEVSLEIVPDEQPATAAAAPVEAGREPVASEHAGEPAVVVIEDPDGLAEANAAPEAPAVDAGAEVSIEIEPDTELEPPPLAQAQPPDAIGAPEVAEIAGPAEIAEVLEIAEVAEATEPAAPQAASEAAVEPLSTETALQATTEPISEVPTESIPEVAAEPVDGFPQAEVPLDVSPEAQGGEAGAITEELPLVEAPAAEAPAADAEPPVVELPPEEPTAAPPGRQRLFQGRLRVPPPPMIRRPRGTESTEDEIDQTKGEEAPPAEAPAAGAVGFGLTGGAGAAGASAAGVDVFAQGLSADLSNDPFFGNAVAPLPNRSARSKRSPLRRPRGTPPQPPVTQDVEAMASQLADELGAPPLADVPMIPGEGEAVAPAAEGAAEGGEQATGVDQLDLTGSDVAAEAAPPVELEEAWSGAAAVQPSEPVDQASALRERAARAALLPARRGGAVDAAVPGEAQAPPYAVVPHRSARGHRAVPILLVAMLVLMLVAAAGIFLFLKQRYAIEQQVTFENYQKLTQRERRELETQQRNLLTDSNVALIARRRLAAKAPPVEPGFLADPVAFAMNERRVRWPSNRPGTMVYTFEGIDRDGDAARVQALVEALLDKDADMVLAAKTAAGKAAEFTREIERVTRELEAVKVRRDRAMRTDMDAAAAERTLPQLEQREAELLKASQEATAALRAADDELKRAEAAAAAGAGTGAAVPSSSPSLGETADSELAELSKKHGAASDMLSSLRKTVEERAEQSRRSLDAAIQQFEQRLAVAEGLLQDNPELKAYVEAAQRLQALTQKLSGNLLDRQQKQYERSVEGLRWVEARIEARRKEIWDGDPQLKQFSDDLKMRERGYNAAVQHEMMTEAAQIRREMEAEQQQIEKRKLEIGSVPDLEAMAKRLKDEVTLCQKQLESDRRDTEEMMKDLERTLSLHAPAVQKLPDAQRNLANQLTQSGEALAKARQQYAAAMEEKNGELNSALKEAERVEATFAKKIEDRKKTLVALSAQALTADQREQCQRLVAERREAVGAAKRTEAAAYEQWSAVRRDVLERTSLISTAKAARAELTELNPRKAKLDKDLEQLTRNLSDMTSADAARAYPLPIAPEPKVAELPDPRPMWALLSLGGIAIVFSGLILLSLRGSSERHAAPAAAPAAQAAARPPLALAPVGTAPQESRGSTKRHAAML